jgi:hypothetical protein
MKRPVSIKLPTNMSDAVRAMPGSPGDNLNNILDEYSNRDAMVAAVARHMRNPAVDPSESKQTAFYMDTRRITDLRSFTKQTYLPVEGLVRILIQDYLQQRHP